MVEMKLSVHSEMAEALDAKTSNHVIVKVSREDVLEILALQKMVLSAKLYQLEKFNYTINTEWHEYADTEAEGDPELSNIELETILVSDDDFYFKAAYRHASYHMQTEPILIADLVAAFNLEETPEPVVPVPRLVIEINEGLLLDVKSDQPVEYVVYDYAIEDCSEDQVLVVPALGAIEDNVVDIYNHGGIGRAQLMSKQLAKVFNVFDDLATFDQ